jgi:UDP-N-acetylmuramoyl-L-alanyl-D-glutamate--2,6-diaminopimelate ligase
VIRGVTYDSRAVAPGDLFVALTGSVSDGHDYLESAVRMGAAALLVERESPGASISSVPVVVTTDTRRALAPIATHFFGRPADEMSLIGITGTNGKTSTSYLIESMLTCAGIRTGLVGTVEVRYTGERQPSVNTTPESLDLQRMLRSMSTRNVESVVMEVSSHGLELGRVSGCHFDVGAFTNLTQDHLDFHGDMDAYLKSKALLFRDYLSQDAAAVINVDDPASDALINVAEDAGARILRVSKRSDRDADVRLLDAQIELSGSRARVALPSETIELQISLLGDFNLENLVVAAGIAEALEIPHEAIAVGAARCPQVPGRVEVIGAELESAPTVIVDYAHTPDAVDKLLHAVRPLVEGRLITLFGCGGDRDRSKRPLMAEAVARSSDRVLATSDNPRTEDPEAILRDVEVGLRSLRRVEPEVLDESQAAYAVVVDRRQAIDHAIAIARPHDTVVLAGKGHEDYQILGHQKLPFDDRIEAARALRAWHGGGS